MANIKENVRFRSYEWAFKDKISMNLEEHSRESRCSWTSLLRLLHHNGSRLRVRWRAAFFASKIQQCWRLGLLVVRYRANYVTPNFPMYSFKEIATCFMLMFTLVTWHLTDKRLIAFLLVSFPPTGLLVMILIILSHHSKRYSRGPEQSM